MKTNWKALVFVGLLSSATTLAGFKLLSNDSEKDVIFKEAQSESLARFTSTGTPAGAPGDFVYAAEATTPTVVHIKSTMSRQSSSREQQIPDIFRDFFGDGFGGGGGRSAQPAEATGSGVIISPDGYIVTNNHVVEGAQELEVTLHNKAKLRAKVIGTDPSTDIAVIKIESKDLPAVTIGNSDAVKVGEWVVAVGNPFNLESTVTAGIVSAKGRGLGIIGSSRRYGNNATPASLASVDSPLESFIQTDAVVNPGNSGGALVNLKGELIGINTAIASPTGSFAGYAFAVPSSIVKKVSSDLIKFGNVQRGYLGISLDDLDSRKAEEYGVKVNDGVYVRDFTDNSAAKAGGVEKGDVIVKVDGLRINSIPELQQSIGLHKPGDKVNLTVNRDGKEKDITVTLRNRTGGSDIIKRDESAAVLSSLGAQFGNLTDGEKQKLAKFKHEGGVKVLSVEGGKLARTGVEEGFIVTKVNGKAVRSVKEFESALAGKEDSMVQFEGLYPDAPYDVYSFGFRL
ncbi:Periplasmic pH-dependent serine endoprotease DegQ [Dyadobacter sp. CECT 9275]|uniref:Periplasmic pH-dependent serine endoprotease DegQ n=1 Tax=Dyadobacter helix TaxID=2822344 RepID=A0A916N6G8_9BACT|nr:Do family serine endopeptidase [Dyadobacter sp. CECT 9275]CAG5009840.1 Periplasmic pH-dependent serine endoprotease DegQ [Dyadobacter sp. CECT 9275]